MIQILDESRWPELEEIFAREFNSALPHKGRSTIVADIGEDGEITGFFMTEVLLRVGLIHTTGSSSRAMLKWLEKNMLPDSAVIAIASSERFNGLCEAFQMRPIEGQVYRRDF